MTISTTTLRTSAVGAGSVLAIPYSFATLASGDLLVIERVTATGAETELTENASSDGYTATYSSTGGTVTTSDSIASTSQVHIIHQAPRTQTLDLVQGGSFGAEKIEAALDKNTRMINENRDRISRLIRFPQSDPSAAVVEMSNSIDRKGEYLFFDSSTGAPTTAAAVDTTTTTISTFIKTVLDDADANAAMATLNGRPVISVVNHGADNTGGSTSQTAIQAALTAADDGDIVWLPAGRYLFDAAFADIVKDVSIMGDNAVLVASTRITAPVFKWNTRDDFVVSGLIYDGEETQASFSGTTEADIYGLIHLDTCDNVKISNISGLECRNIVKMTDSTNCTVRDIHHIGVLALVDVEANLHTTILDNSGVNNRIYRVHSENGGSIVLGTSTTLRLVVDGCSGTKLWDNGIYISSGTHCIIKGNTLYNFDDGTQDCIKVRGSYNIVANNIMTDIRNGIRVTGVGNSFGGDGNIVIGNSIDTYAIRGITVTNIPSDIFTSNMVIANNTITNGAGTGGSGTAIEARVVKGLTITGNAIRTNVSDYAIFVWSVAGSEVEEVVIANNVITKITSGEGIRVQDMKNATVSGNVFEDLGSHGIRLLRVSNTIFLGNVFPDTTQVLIKDSTDFNNYNNIFLYNFGKNRVDSAHKLNSYEIGFDIQNTLSYENETLFSNNDILTG